MSNKQKNGGTKTKIGCIEDIVHQVKLLVHLAPRLMVKEILRHNLLLKLISLVYIVTTMVKLNDPELKQIQSTKCRELGKLVQTLYYEALAQTPDMTLILTRTHYKNIAVIEYDTGYTILSNVI